MIPTITYNTRDGRQITFTPARTTAEYSDQLAAGVDPITAALWSLTPPKGGKIIPPSFWSRNKLVQSYREVGDEVFQQLAKDIVAEYWEDDVTRIKNPLATLVYRCHEYAAIHNDPRG